MNTNLVLGMDIGGTNMRFGLVDEQYQLSSFTIQSTRLILDCEDSIEKLVKCVRGYCNTFLGGQLPTAISAGFPSTIDKAQRIVISTPNIKVLQNLAVADVMEQALGIPTFINRDVNFLFLYDMYYHQLNQEATILGFYVGTGLGNAISIGGKLLLGKNGVAAELGHIPVLGRSEPCGCGNSGCIEMFASGKYLEKLQEKRFSGTLISEMFVRHKEEPELIAFIDYLSLPIATEINIFDPDYVILGGGIVQMKEFPIALLEECIHQHTRKPYPNLNLELLYSSPKQENGVIGAGIYAYKRFESEDYK